MAAVMPLMFSLIPIENHIFFSEITCPM